MPTSSDKADQPHDDRDDQQDDPDPEEPADGGGEPADKEQDDRDHGDGNNKSIHFGHVQFDCGSGRTVGEHSRVTLRMFISSEKYEPQIMLSRLTPCRRAPKGGSFFDPAVSNEMAPPLGPQAVYSPARWTTGAVI